MLPGSTLQLTINQQFAKIGINISRGQQEIRQPQADVQIVQRAAKMEIDQGPGEQIVDGEEAHSALGHKPTLRMLEDVASQARQIALEAIGEIASEGDKLMKIEEGNTIPSIALAKWDNPPEGIDYTGPFEYSPVKVHYTPHPTKITWTPGGAEINITPNQPIINYSPGSVDVYVAQKNWLQIGLKGKYLNREF